MTYVLAQQVRSSSFKLLQRFLPPPALFSSFQNLGVLGIHVPIQVDSFFQVEMMSGFERALLYRVKLHTLYLYLKYWR